MFSPRVRCFSLWVYVGKQIPHNKRVERGRVWALSLKVLWEQGRYGVRNTRPTLRKEREISVVLIPSCTISFLSVCNCGTEQRMLRLSLPPQLVYLGIFSKTSPEGFFLTDGSRSYTVDNVNHHCSTKWSYPCREPFLNPVSSCPQHRITIVKTVTFNYTRLLSPCLLIIWCIGLNLHSQCFRKPACAQYHCMAPPQIALSLMAHQLWDLVLNLVLLSSPAIFYT